VQAASSAASSATRIGTVDDSCPAPIDADLMGCAEERLATAGGLPAPRFGQAGVYLLLITKDTPAAQLARLFEYYLLLGAHAIIAFDNSCAADDPMEDARRRAVLQSYARAGLLKDDPRLRCVYLHSYKRDEFPERDMRGASGLVKGIVHADPQLDPPEGSLVIALDDDEILLSDLHLEDLRLQMREQGTCVHHAPWLTFGTSSHRCQPTGSMVRNFYRRAPTESELGPEKAARVEASVKQLGMNPLFKHVNYSHSSAVPAAPASWYSSSEAFGKPIQMWGSQVECWTHQCSEQEHCRNPDAGPDPRPNLRIAHYYTQSEMNWLVKRRRGRTSNGTVAIIDRVPKLYELVEDYSAYDTVDRLLAQIRPSLETQTDAEDMLYRCLSVALAPPEVPLDSESPSTAEERHRAASRATLETHGANDGSRTEHSKTSSPALPSGANAACCSVSKRHAKRVAVTFHGAFRSVAFTRASIERNLLAPIVQAAGAVDVFAHVMGTSTAGDRSAYLLRPCRVSIESQELADRRLRHTERGEQMFNQMSASGSIDPTYGPEELINILRTKFSMASVATMVADYETGAGFRYTHVVSARPDTRIASPLVWDPLSPGIRIPNAHHWLGLNDRFAYGDRDSMMSFMARPHRTLAQKKNFALDRSDLGADNPMSSLNVSDLSAASVTWWSEKVNSEKFNCFVMAREPRLTFGLTPLCVQRVGSSGTTKVSDIQPPNGAPLSCRRHAGLALVHDYEHQIWADRVDCGNDYQRADNASDEAMLDQTATRCERLKRAELAARGSSALYPEVPSRVSRGAPLWTLHP